MSVLPQILPRSARVWPPAGGMPPVSEVLRLWRESSEGGALSGGESIFSTLRGQLTQMFPGRGARFFNSGKAALVTAFRDLRAQGFVGPVILGDYSCPDIASAAIKAGCQIVLLDISSRSLDLEASASFDELKVAKAILVLPNLYGLSDSLVPWSQARDAGNLAIIDDACQSAFTLGANGRVGNRGPGVSVLSFGRGKALNGVGGGALLKIVDKTDPASGDLSERTNRIEPSFLLQPKFHKAWLTALFESPTRYGIPSRVPFLGLGQTVYHADFEVGPMSPFAAAVALAQVRARDLQCEQFRANTARWIELLTNLPIVLPVNERAEKNNLTLIRFPILLSDSALRERVWDRLSRAGLGASASYPLPLHSYPEVRKALAPGLPESWPNAELVSQTILTLPTHRFVTNEVFEKTARILREELLP